MVSLASHFRNKSRKKIVAILYILYIKVHTLMPRGGIILKLRKLKGYIVPSYPSTLLPSDVENEMKKQVYKMTG